MLSSIEWNRTHRGVPLKNKKNNQKIIKLLCHTVVKGINLFHSEVVVFRGGARARLSSTKGSFDGSQEPTPVQDV